MSGDGATKPPFVVGKLDSDGDWHVLLMVPFAGISLERVLSVDEAERLARQLVDYAALVRDKIGLPGGKAMP